MTENLSQEVCAAKPLSFGSSGPAAVVVTSAGDLSTVDLSKVSSGQEGAIVTTWAAAGETSWRTEKNYLPSRHCYIATCMHR